MTRSRLIRFWTILYSRSISPWLFRRDRSETSLFGTDKIKCYIKKNATPVRVAFLFQRQACKPDSVVMRHPARGSGICSVIYLGTQLLAGSYDPPPGSGEQPSDTGIHGLSTHQVYGSRCRHRDR